MPVDGPRACTRRAVLAAALPFRAPSGSKGARFSSEQFRYIDRSTEFPVLRLTDPSHAAGLPVPWARAVARGGFLLHWSDRTGSRQAYRLDLRSGAAQQLTEASALDGASLNLLPDERACLFFNGPSLCLLDLRKMKEREIYRVAAGFERTPGLAVSADGDEAAWIENREGTSFLRIVRLPRGGAATILASPAPLADPAFRPRGEGILCRRGPTLWVAGYDDRRDLQLALAPGEPGSAFWSPDGATVLYLNFPAGKTTLNSIREADPRTNTERLVAPTSQYASFGANADATVFAGASASRASPLVLLMLRVTRRELPLCEHRAANPAQVAPVFSPDSQRIFFNSDRDGGPAIYSLAVDRLVART